MKGCFGVFGQRFGPGLVPSDLLLLQKMSDVFSFFSGWFLRNEGTTHQVEAEAKRWCGRRGDPLSILEICLPRSSGVVRFGYDQFLSCLRYYDMMPNMELQLSLWVGSQAASRLAPANCRNHLPVIWTLGSAQSYISRSS